MMLKRVFLTLLFKNDDGTEGTAIFWTNASSDGSFAMATTGLPIGYQLMRVDVLELTAAGIGTVSED